MSLSLWHGKHQDILKGAWRAWKEAENIPEVISVAKGSCTWNATEVTDNLRGSVGPVRVRPSEHEERLVVPRKQPEAK